MHCVGWVSDLTHKHRPLFYLPGQTLPGAVIYGKLKGYCTNDQNKEEYGNG